MSVYKLQKAKKHAFVGEKFYAGAKNRLAAASDRYGYLTGLTKEQEKFYEKALRLPDGELERKSDWFGEWGVFVTAKGLLLDEEQPEDALAISILKQKSNVGLTAEDANKSGIEYLLTSEDHDAKVALDNRSYKMKAFVELHKMTDEDCRNYLIGTGRKPAGMSPASMRKLVGDDAERSPKEFYNTVMDEDKDLRVFVHELIHYGILVKDGSQFKSTQSGEVVGFSVEQLMDSFKQTDQQPIYLQFQKELQRKKRVK